jgi:hypothetical protein
MLYIGIESTKSGCYVHLLYMIIGSWLPNPKVSEPCLNCHVLTLVPLFCLCFSMVRAWVGVGSLCLFFYVGFCVWPSMVLNQRKVSLVVSDWESYLGSLFPPLFGACLFSVSVYVARQDRFSFRSFTLLFFFVFQCSVWLIKYYIMNTYHAADWSSDPSRCYSSSEEEDKIRSTNGIRKVQMAFILTKWYIIVNQPKRSICHVWW